MKIIAADFRLNEVSAYYIIIIITIAINIVLVENWKKMLVLKYKFTTFEIFWYKLNSVNYLLWIMVMKFLYLVITYFVNTVSKDGQHFSHFSTSPHLVGSYEHEPP